MKIIYIGLCEHDYTLQKETEIILFGYGKRSGAIYHYIVNCWERCKIVCFVDNDKKKQGQYYKDTPILSVEEAIEKFPDAAYVISTVCVADIVRQLGELGISKIHIIRGVRD